MNIKEKLLKPAVLWHVGAVVVFFAIASIFAFPAWKGFGVEAHDVKSWVGMSQEVKDYRENADQQILWTNSMFGGMPSTQISMVYEGSQFTRFMRDALQLWLPQPIGFIFAYFICFYIMSCMLRIKPLIGALGALAYGFSTYLIVIIQAGHNTKAVALGYAPLLIAGFILAYRGKRWLLGVALSAMFMAIEMQANHLQITYYFGFILIAMGVVELIRHFEKEQMVRFAKITGSLVLAYGLAILMNIGNITGTAEYAPHTIRGGSDLAEYVEPDTTQANGPGEMVDASGSLSISYITHWSYGRGETFTLLVPNFKGGKSTAIGANQDNKKHLDEAGMYKQYVAQSSQYWGDQPGTSGPVYAGAFMFLLAFVSLFYVRDRYRYALLAVAVLAIFLSWGKNFLGFTEFFVNFFPGYGSFRTVTMILVIVELAIPLLVIMFLQRLYTHRQEIAENIKPFLFVSGGVLLLLIAMWLAPGTFTDFLSTAELDNLSNMELTDPSNAVGYSDYLADLELVRESIFVSDVGRSIIFALLGAGAVLAFVRKLFKLEVLGSILIVLLLADLFQVNKRYLGTEEQGKGYIGWVENYKRTYPWAAGDAENQIYEFERQLNPDIDPLVISAQAELRESFGEETSGTEKQRRLDWIKFRILNRNTNYRVYEQNNLTSSSYAPYFHKTIGGYHGAKLSRYQDLIEYQLSKGNKAVMNMLNMKYVIQPITDQRNNYVNSQLLQVNNEAMGNAWFVQSTKKATDPMAEMEALNSSKEFELEVFSMTPVFVNGQQTSGKVKLNGTEQVAFWNFSVGPDFQPVIDTADIPMPYPNIQPGEKICYIRDSTGLQWVYASMIDTTFDRIITLETTGLVGFDPTKEAVVGADFADGIGDSYSGDGTIEMISYHPEEMVYESSSTAEQLAVFSEMYYPLGWIAYIDDQPVDDIKRVNYVLRGLVVPAGDHTIKFKYDLDSYKSAGMIMWSSSIVVILLVLFAFWQEYKRKGSAEPLLVAAADDRDEEFAAAKAAKDEATKAKEEAMSKEEEEESEEDSESDE